MARRHHHTDEELRDAALGTAAGAPLSAALGPEYQSSCDTATAVIHRAVLWTDARTENALAGMTPNHVDPLTVALLAAAIHAGIVELGPAFEANPAGR